MLKKLTILIFCIQFNAEAQTSALAIGDSLFANGKYTKAIEQYQNHPNQKKNRIFIKISKKSFHRRLKYSHVYDAILCRRHFYN